MKSSTASLISATLALLLQLTDTATANIGNGHSLVICNDAGDGTTLAHADKGTILGAITASMKPGVGPPDSDCHPPGSYKSITSNGRFWSGIVVSSNVRISAWANTVTRELYVCTAEWVVASPTITCSISGGN